MGFMKFVKGMIGGGEPKSPTEEWILGAEAIVTDADDDAADWSPDDGREALSQWWEISCRDDALQRLNALVAGEGAWDLVRAIHVSRMSLGAQYLSREEARVYGVRAGQRAQQLYESWQALAMAYWDARREWANAGSFSMESPEELQQKMGRLHYEAWSHVPFDTPLTEVDAPQ